MTDSITKTYRGDEPIYFGSAHALADAIGSMPYYGVWATPDWRTNRQAKFALSRTWPCPSWVEITRHELFQSAAYA